MAKSWKLFGFAFGFDFETKQRLDKPLEKGWRGLRIQTKDEIIDKAMSQKKWEKVNVESNWRMTFRKGERHIPFWLKNDLKMGGVRIEGHKLVDEEIPTRWPERIH